MIKEIEEAQELKLCSGCGGLLLMLLISSIEGRKHGKSNNGTAGNQAL